jgi:U6 snRNA-associated Sm-like protein LSm2
MLFFSFFKTLIEHEVTVELKNDIQLRGTLKSVDQYLNIKLDDISVVEELKYPHLSSVKNVFIRGSVVRYVHLPGASVDTQLLEDATRRGRLKPGCILFGACADERDRGSSSAGKGEMSRCRLAGPVAKP